MGYGRYAHWLRAALMGSVAGAAIMSASPSMAATTPDGVTPASVVDTTNTQPFWVGVAIRNEAGNSGGTCTGLLINPRTVLFAAHCVDSVSPGGYDAPTSPGNRAQVGYTTDPTFGRTNLREFLFGLDFVVPAGDARVVNGSSVMVWYDPRSRFGSAAIPSNGTFLPADVAIAGFDTPNELLGRDAANGMALLFSPVTSLVPVRMGGYGTSGNGFDGTRTSAVVEESYFRRLVNNQLGFLGDEQTLTRGIYPLATADILEPPGLVYQDLYWADFDDPSRATRPFFNGPGNDPVCPSTNLNCRLDHDPFPGTAVAGEGITGSGDSGSPLATSAFGRQVSLGVLSQGSRFFYESIGDPNDNFVRFTNFSNFGTLAGYNPLFLFWDQIVVNNPYKYVTTSAGDGEWTDATRWVQELDPLYMVLAGSTLVNGLPTTPALGVSGATPNVGAINASPSPAAACAFLGTCPPTGGTSEPLPGTVASPGNVGLPGQQTMAGTVNLKDGDGSPQVLDPSVPQALIGGANDPQVLNPTAEAATTGTPTANGGTTLPGNPPSEPMTTALWSSGTLIPVGTGALTGPGTTNFVPNNTNGTAGLQNSTRFFEVNLRSAGTTFLTGTTVTIDRLNVRGASSGLNIRSGAQLNTTISSYVDAGTLTVNGGFSTTNLFVLGGKVMGAGSITGNLVNTAGMVAPGNSIGTLNVTGPYSQGVAGILEVEMAAGTSDLLAVSGNAQLAGTVRFTQFGTAPTLGQTNNFITTGGTVSGRFTAVQDLLPGALFPVLTYGSNFVSVTIADFCSFASGPVQTPVCQALNSSTVQTDPDMIPALGGLQALDSASLSKALGAMSPTRANAQAMTAFTTGDLLRGQFASRAYSLLGAAGEGEVAKIDLARTQLASASPSSEALASAATAALAASTAAASDIDLGNGYGLFFAGDVAIFETEQAGGIGTDKADAAALTAGIDHSDGNGFVAGVAVSYLQSTVAQDYGLGGSTSSDGMAVSAYASLDQGALSADVYASGAWHSYETERTLLLAPLTLGIASGETDASQLQLGASVGYDIATAAWMRLAAVGGLHYINVDIDAYTETGAGPLGAAVNARSIDSLKSQLGGEMAFHLEPGNKSLVPMLRVVWNHEFMNDPLVVTSGFAGAPGATFKAPGPDLGTDWATVGFGVQGEVGNDTNFYLRVQKDIGRDGAERHEVSAAARFGF
ncbi:MAG: autotransporter domain-containing protein [Alphaproteobacteria bacterium]|nr:autotransporter domain-containing protein [Alphaproteobacteria bacterium]